MALTKYKEGSLRELWSIALPLMLSSMSVMMMLFVDRLLLAHYSIDAFNSVVNAMTLGWAFLGSWMTLTSISEVFVAQYNGAERRDKFGEPVWQMIWMSVGSLFCFIPLSLWGGDWFYGAGPNKVMEKEYFALMMFFGPSCPLYAALCGFFIGQGKTKFITWLAIATNIINAGLDIALIFGVEGWIAPMGVTGAAIATSSSTIFQALVLGYIFLKKENREAYGTSNFRFKATAFWQCVRIGIPGAVFMMIEILGWVAYYAMMTTVGENYITIAGICQSIAILFYFFADGISKAATAIAGNFIGAGNHLLVPKMLVAGTRLHILFFLALVGCFFVTSDLIIAYFLPNATPEKVAFLEEPLKNSIFFIIIYLLFEGLRMLFSGVLTAAGDTLFLLVMGSLAIWALLVAPIYFVVVLGEAPVESGPMICAFYSICAAFFYFWRFRDGKWKELSITA